MIMQFVRFRSGLSEDDVLKLMDARAPQYRELPGLLQKYYVRDKRNGGFGGIYICYGFSLSPAGPRNPSLHGLGFLGRCPGLERLKSQGSSLFIQYPCAFFSLFSHSFLPHLLSHNLRAGSACYSHYPVSKKLSLPAFRAEIH